MTLISRSAGGLWRKKKNKVLASSTIIADTIPLIKFVGVKYIIQFSNDSEDKFNTIEVLAAKKSGGNLEDNVVGNLGDDIDVDTNVIISGSDVILQLTNNEIYQLDVAISKLILS